MSAVALRSQYVLLSLVGKGHTLFIAHPFETGRRRDTSSIDRQARLLHIKSLPAIRSQGVRCRSKTASGSSAVPDQEESNPPPHAFENAVGCLPTSCTWPLANDQPRRGEM